MNKLIVETYFASFENYDMLLETTQPLEDQGIGIELHAFNDDAFNRRALAQRNRLKKYYTTFHGPHMGVELASAPGSDGQKNALHAWEEAFKLYRAFDAHSIVMHTHQLAFRPQERKTLQKLSIDNMNIVLDMAKEAGANVLVENVGWHNRDSYLFNEDEFIHLFSQLRPWAKCLIDTGHAFINRWDMEKVISALADKIDGYHLHNNDGESDIHRPMFEEGLFYTREDTLRLLRIMNRYTPNADWILEYAPDPKTTPQVVIDECRQFYSYANII